MSQYWPYYKHTAKENLAYMHAMCPADTTGVWAIHFLNEEGNPSQRPSRHLMGKWKDILNYAANLPGFWFHHLPARIVKIDVTEINSASAEEIQKLAQERAEITARMEADQKRLAELKRLGV